MHSLRMFLRKKPAVPTSASYERIADLKEMHKKTWRGNGDASWISGLTRTVGGLAYAVVVEASTPVSPQLVNMYLAKVASICWNWLEMREEEGRG